ncbi:Non-canonical non-ribosomal peptide synthetase FUB8 [Colletotrichum spinosum]|uniref:gluconokinase n=1 Tax=Colletotrichum spinosum TaxID=1347390 RepID=A0A4R8QII3_9PEZI|nr:Non-canonical non-ribosomal peptide synthetase FUB8 [Colletotrichum spinosum]
MTPPSVYGPASATLPSSSLGANPLAQSTVAAQDWDNDDGTLKTVDELVRRRARAHPDRVIVSYPSSGISYVDYTMRQLDVFAYRVAKFYEQRIPSRLTSDEKPTTVAVLGPSNFDYLVTMLALTKLGHTTLFLSTRISQEAIESLVTVTGAHYLLADTRYLETAEGTKQTLPHLDVFEIASQSTYDFEIEVHADTRLDHGRDLSIETNNLIYIIHSSGSTGLPKPIYQTQKSAIANYASSMNMRAFITLPLYHNHGICNLYRAIYCGKPIHLYNADLPLTREHLTGIMRRHKFEIFYGVPYALKLLAETDEGMDLLCQLKTVMYGGSACPDDLGDTLVKNGVNLVGHYGATEVGQLMTSFRPADDKAWNYVRVHDKLEPYLRWIPRGPNLFECCVLPGWPSKVATNQDDGSYCTKDLFEPHATIPKAWKYIARLDDTIALVNGEKFNPVHLEGTIRSNKNIAECVVFGVGRPSLGALIVPAATLAGKTDDEMLEAVWPVVESASRNVEAYARVSKNMIKLLPYDCAYPRTDKGSVIRQAFYKRYAQDIDQVYDRADASSGDLKKLSAPELRDFIREGLLQTLAKKVQLDDDTDFFSLGLDSLQAIQMRSDILRTVDVGGHKLGQTVVFDHPSINKLSSYLYGLGAGEDAETEVAIETQMSELIDKYDTSASVETAPRSSIAVTGATGSLGAHVVARLAADPTVKTIYCFTRAPSDADAALRVKSSLIQRRIYHNLPAPSRRKLVALAADLADAHLGLPRETYARVRQDLRTVIHCAWSVNFNMRLSSFERGNIAGVNHLMALCRAAAGGAAATFNFCSSVSTVARAPAAAGPVPESVPDLEWAQGMGYAQSKCVAEHLCARAAAAAAASSSSSSGVRARVLRIGQIVADTQHGVWNATEAVPMMLQTAVTVGALPRLAETPSWLPVDTVAQAVVDISTSEADGGGVFANVANPSVFSWTRDLLPALRAAGLDFDEVEPREWVRRLRASDPDPAANPPIKLVDFFASKYDRDDLAPSKTYVTDTACSLSPALAAAPVLDQRLVDSFVAYFKANHWAEKRQAAVPSKTVVLVAGPCGSGKSTLAASLASWLGAPFVEGDSLHSRVAVDKMSGNLALTDDDRARWLDRIGKRAVEALEDLGYGSVVVSCSALKKSYRDTLRDVISRSDGARAVFLDLQCEPETLVKRISERKGHYMLASMVEGQVGVYEPAGLEEVDVFPVEGEGKPEEVLEEAKWLLEQAKKLH